MLRPSSRWSQVGRVILVLSLCALTVAFALEAKFAWYGPELGLTRDISAAKAMPADTPATVLQRIHVDHAVPTAPQVKWLAIFSATFVAAAMVAAAGASVSRMLACAPASVSTLPHFSESHFIRPPPVIL